MCNEYYCFNYLKHLVSLLSVQSGNGKFMMIYLEKLCCIQKDASCEKSHLTLADEKPFEEAL